LIYCPDGARIYFAIEERYINRKYQTYDMSIAPEEQNINKKFISERFFAPEERYINRKTP
jgi:hypothetical protein